MPQRLQAILSQKQKEIQAYEEQLILSIPELLTVYNSHQQVSPKVKSYIGEEGLKTIYYDSLNAKEILCICQGSDGNQQALSMDPQYLKDFIEETIIREIPTKEILEDTPTVREYEKRYQSKVHQIFISPKVTKGSFMHVDKNIYGDKVAYISHDNLVGILIEDKTIARYESQQFEILWNFYKLSK